MKKLIVLTIIMLLLIPATDVEAFWWLFGRNENEVNISYLYINDLSYDESGQDITLYYDLLEDGLINIRGRAVIGRGQIGSVLVSIDGKESWNSAELSDDGAFQYQFRPEIGKSYEIYIEAMETAGRTNEVDETFKTVTVSDNTYREVIDNKLKEIFESYMAKDSNSFMNFVSWDFVGGDISLEQAINKDFSNFLDIEIDYNLLNLSLNSEGKFVVVLDFSRRVISNNDGQTLTDRGITDFVFNLEDEGPMLYSMDHPLIFGISDAQNIASGAINSAENNQIISVDSEGNVELKDIEDIVNDTDEEEMDEGSEVDLSYIVTKIGGYYGYYEPIWQGYNFSTDTVMDLDWDSDGYYGGAPDVAVGDDPGSGGGEGHGDEIGSTLVVESDIGHIMLAESDIKNVTEVPADGYSYEIHEYNGAYRMEPGKCYALKLRDGNYAVVYFDGFETIKETADEFQETTTLYYKYRNDGGRQF